MEMFEGWEQPKRILGIFAHPDDPEFFCGASFGLWANQGHSVTYCLLTNGDKGTSDPLMTRAELANIRREEQLAAARSLGVQKVIFCDHEDACLTPDMQLRQEVARIIRRERPQILVTNDPTNFFPAPWYVNHPDHRAAGQVVCDAAFPGVGLRLWLPEHFEEGLEPIKIEELWLTVTHQPDIRVNVTDFWEKRIQATLMHVSQVGKPDEFVKNMRERRMEGSTVENPVFEEHFRRMVFK